MLRSYPPTASGEGAVLNFPPRKAYVALASEFVKTFCAEHTEDAEVIARAQLAAHELAENVVKYSSGTQCSIRVQVQHSDGRAPGQLLITTQNEVEPTALAVVDAYLCKLEQAPNPDHFYDEQIAETVKRTDGSGLGLARIRSEALMEISHLAQQGQLMITAKASLRTKGQASNE